jgi:hypothetical protein
MHFPCALAAYLGRNATEAQLGFVQHALPEYILCCHTFDS